MQPVATPPWGLAPSQESEPGSLWSRDLPHQGTLFLPLDAIYTCKYRSSFLPFANPLIFPQAPWVLGKQKWESFACFCLLLCIRSFPRFQSSELTLCLNGRNREEQIWGGGVGTDNILKFQDIKSSYTVKRWLRSLNYRSRVEIEGDKVKRCVEESFIFANQFNVGGTERAGQSDKVISGCHFRLTLSYLQVN